MDGMLLTQVGGLAVATLAVNPTLAFLNAWRKESCAYNRTGEYNFDGRDDTADWANKRDTATGQWELIRIIGYVKPSTPGAGRVLFCTLDEHSEERLHSWRILKWEEDRENRCQITSRQGVAIQAAGNRWPKAEAVDPTDISLLAEAVRDAATSANSAGSRVTNSGKLISGKLHELVRVLTLLNDKVCPSVKYGGGKAKKS